MKILALVSEAYGAGGGVAQYNRDFIGAVAASSASPSVDVLARRASSAAAADSPAIRLHRPRASKIGFTLGAILFAIRARPDLIFCGHLHMAPLGWVIARLTGALFMMQVHGIEVWKRPGPLIRGAVKAVDLLFCVSRDTRSRTLCWADLAPERAVVLANTVGEVFTPANVKATRERLGVGKAKVLLSVGRLDRREQYKGQDRVIAAIPGLVAAGLDVVYLIAGDGDDQPRLEGLAASFRDRVRFLGYVPASDLTDLYRAADLFVLPSTGEGFGIVFLEAMACGTPALGLAVGGAVDALEELGTAASPDDLTGDLIRKLKSKPAPPATLASCVADRFGRRAFNDRVDSLLTRLKASRTSK